MSDLLHCPRCDKWLSPDSFQKGNKGWCKPCLNAYNKQRRQEGWRVDPMKSTKQSENDTVDWLHSKGIYAISGKAMLGYLVDAVAWGCIGLEIKSSKPIDGTFKFSFTARQQRVGINTDFIILVPRRQTGNTYHVFPAKHPCFYHLDGKLKTGVSYKPNVGMQKKLDNVRLSDELMNEYQDRWDLINLRRDEISQELIQGRLSVNYQMSKGRHHTY